MTAPATERPLVLVAGDAEPGAALLRDLDSLGFRTAVAPLGRALVGEAVTHQADLCLLLASGAAAAGDDDAGQRTALETCRRLKSDPRTKRLPVLIAVGSEDSATYARAAEAGADDVLPLHRDAALLGLRARALLRLRSASDALDESSRRLRELEQLRDDLMKMIVHDLKTPLTSIIATLEILADGDLGAIGDEQGQAVADMRARGDDLLTLIDDLLQVWRIESTALPVTPEEIAPDAFIHDLLREWEYRFRQEEATVAAEVLPGTKTFRGDRALLRRVFANLFQNALAYSPPPAALRLSARDDRRGVLFTVADSGPGIPPEYHEVIFRKFHRLPRPNEAPARGSGLGLAFCRLAVEAHGGRIWVQSAEGKGSAFHVLLPLEPAVARMRRAWNL